MRPSLGALCPQEMDGKQMEGGGQVKTGADGSIQAVIMETIVKVLAKITRHQEGISWRFMGKCG